MLETICIPCENVRIGSKDIPYQLIKGRLLKSGVKEISTEPALQDNLIEYQNTYYKIGTSRMEVKDTKVVDENYVLSYESYLTIKDLTNIDKELDVISIISEGKIIAEFIMLSMNEMIFTYKSEIYIFIRSESNNEEITPNNNIYILMGKKH